MKCKYCNEEIKQDNEGEDYYSVISRFFTCTDNPNQCRNHEPAEPEAQEKNNEGVNRTNQAASPVTEGSQQMETVAENEQRSMRETKLVADHGPRVDTRRFPQATEAQPPHTVKIGAGIYTPRHCTCPNQADEDGAYCPICGKEKLSSQEPEAGSTRPEMPPKVETVNCKCSCNPWCGCVCHNYKFGPASVQQEPLRYPLKLNQPQLSTIDEWVNDPKNLFGDREARAINLPIFARQMLSCQPAAPRTQGREVEIISREIVEGLFTEHSPEKLERYRLFIAGKISSILAQAWTQPAPRYLRAMVVKILSNCANKYCHPGGYGRPEQNVINEQIENAVKIAETFFTALPEATKEEK